MQSFRFTLDKVLKVRQLETTKAKQMLAAAQLASAQAWAAMESARAERVAFAAHLEKRRKERLPASERQRANEEHKACLQAEQKAAAKFQETLALVAGRRAELEEAERKEKALEQLRDQQYEAHLVARQSGEQAAINHLAQVMSPAVQ